MNKKQSKLSDFLDVQFLLIFPAREIEKISFESPNHCEFPNLLRIILW